jgi:tripartite-type tricarboxylate transporter receptor subunit TctC
MGGKTMKANRIFAYSIAVLSTLGLSILAGAAGAADDFPGRQIQVVVPSGPGGGMDRMVRQIIPFVEKRLGANLVVKNIEGGAFAVGTVSVYQAAADCKTLLSSHQPLHALTYLVQSVPYDEDSFIPVVSVEKADSIIYVKKDARWKTIKDLIDDARANPGKIKVGASTITDTGYFAIKALEKATGVQFNLVAYNGGAEFRNAVRGNEVEVASDDMVAGISFKDEARILAAFTGNDDPLPAERNLWGEGAIPSINSELGIDIRASFVLTGAMYVRRGCFTDYPDRYQLLTKVFLEALNDPDYQEVLRKTGEEKKRYVVPGPEYDKIEKSELSELLPILREQGLIK